jgi:hypothetical protein
MRSKGASFSTGSRWTSVPSPSNPGGALVARSVEHLQAHRRLVVTRALLAAAAGFVPVPVVDDLVVARVRVGLLAAIANGRRVDLSGDALLILGDEPQVSRLKHTAITGLTLVALRRAWRKVFVLLAVLRRSDEFAHTFELGTLFDHYCVRHHVGPAIDAAAAQKLRETILAVGRSSRRDTLRGMLEAAARAAVGRMRWPSPSDVAETDPPLPERFLHKVSRVFSEEFGGRGDAYVRSLIGTFDQAWQARPR